MVEEFDRGDEEERIMREKRLICDDFSSNIIFRVFLIKF
jgi:hypothetical protein